MMVCAFVCSMFSQLLECYLMPIVAAFADTCFFGTVAHHAAHVTATRMMGTSGDEENTNNHHPS